MTFRIEITPTARKDLADLPRRVRRQIDQRIVALANDPRPSGSKVLKGRRRGLMRIRVGDYRIIYQILKKRLVILIITVKHRRDVYRRL